MQAASRLSLAELRGRIDAITARFSTAEGLTGLAQELYAVVDVLIRQPRLRRQLADPSTASERRSGLAGAVFDGKVGTSTSQVVKDAVALRWSSAWDLLDALEVTADDVLLTVAENEGALDEIEDELFRFERVLDASSSLTTLLDDYSADPAGRAAVVRQLFEGKVRPVVLQLLEHAVTSQRKRSIVHAIDDLLELGARRQERSLARVVSAVPLTDAQEQRLAERLSDIYGRQMSIRTAIEPSIRGGLVVRVGDEVIDGSIAARLMNARQALAG